MEQKIIIRNEKQKDWDAVEKITRQAFYNLYMPGCVEHYLVHIMREHEDFIPELDFVLELNGRVIGNIMYTQAKLIDENGTDLLNGTNYVFTTNVVEVNEEDIGDLFALRIAGQQLPLMLNVGLCGGVVHYFHFWDQLTVLYASVEGAKNDEQLDKSLFELLAHAQDVVNLLFHWEGIDVIVENVTRVETYEGD